jgi:hypothetical protein
MVDRRTIFVHQTGEKGTEGIAGLRALTSGLTVRIEGKALAQLEGPVAQVPPPCRERDKATRSDSLAQTFLGVLNDDRQFEVFPVVEPVSAAHKNW